MKTRLEGGFPFQQTLAAARSMAEKLTRLGISLSPDDIINSKLALAKYLEHKISAATVHVLGELPCVEELATAGMKASAKPEEIE